VAVEAGRNVGTASIGLRELLGHRPAQGGEEGSMKLIRVVHRGPLVRPCFLTCPLLFSPPPR
jgi:hypothetical protein